MLKYAREDTHYLLHLYSRMKQDLRKIGNGNYALLLRVWELSKEVCLKKYTFSFDPEEYTLLYKNQKKGMGLEFDKRQMSILKDLFAWRDDVARREDESTGFVLPAKMMLRIVKFMPRNDTEMISCCKGFGVIPGSKHFPTLLEIVHRTREIPIDVIDLTKESSVPSSSGASVARKSNSFFRNKAFRVNNFLTFFFNHSLYYGGKKSS